MEKKSKQVNDSRTRPPIIVVLGHVDHGKSSLLEAIRDDFRITQKESGGITQHIGAYVAEYQGKFLTFIDTPGHEAFSAMRSRGASVADIAILVVAADEGIKPQTKEALQQIQEAGIPFVIAFNKIDRPEASAERVKTELAQEGVLVESFGGNVPSAETSATTKQGIPELLELLLLVAEVEDLKSTDEKGSGVILESFLDTKRGNATTVLVRDGYVRVGDIIGTKSTKGKIRILEDFQGQKTEEVGPSTPAVIVGFEKFPKIGEEFKVFEDISEAQAYEEEVTIEPSTPPRQESGEQITMPLIIKADVAGSLEALEGVLAQIPQEKVVLKIIKSEVGDVGEDDLKLAQSADAQIMVFRAKVPAGINELATRQGIGLKRFDIIYEAVEAIRKTMTSLMEPEVQKEEKGKVRILAVFNPEKGKQVVGGKVLEGEARKGVSFEIIRQEEVQGEGRISNIQHNKEDVSVVQDGQEAGFLVDAKEQIQKNDILRFYQVSSQKPHL